MISSTYIPEKVKYAVQELEAIEQGSQEETDLSMTSNLSNGDPNLVLYMAHALYTMQEQRIASTTITGTKA